MSALRDIAEAAQSAPGRNLTALLIGSATAHEQAAATIVDLGLSLHRVDLGAVIAKYADETEKNLDRVFAEAEGTGGVLLLDEAGALFGARDTKDARDRVRRTDADRLLARVESFPGLVIVAVRDGEPLADRFRRRFHYVADLADLAGRARPLEPAAEIPQAPIGIFDSGVGGLSVMREIRRELPAENLIYVADSGFAPYGDRPASYVADRAVAVSDFLHRQGAKAIVVACNTATGAAVDALRMRYDLPIVAIEPAVKPAAAQTRTGVVGVLATTQTLGGPKYTKLVSTYAQGVTVLSQPCPGLVEQIEAGALATATTRALVEQYLQPLLERRADTIVLGCTHYPFVGEMIRSAAGPGVTVIDSAVPVARELRRRLQAAGRLAPEAMRGSESFWTTGAAEQVRTVISQLWGHRVDVHALPSEPSLDARKAEAR